MKLLKKILIALAIIIVIPLVAAFFVKKHYAVEREIIINKPKHLVFDYVRLLKNQDNFSKWATMDPGMKREYKGTDGHVGFVSAWDSKMKDVGKGEQEIKNIVEGERIDYELRFIEPWESTSPAYIITESVDENQTKVKWGFSGKFDYPMNLMLVFMNMDEILGNDFETGLANLKQTLEQ
jgi:uncharacterized protein YndB with AHSA1/START domain